MQVLVRPAPYLQLPRYTHARLVIACKYRPLPILKQALFVLQPSSPFVVFHEFLEPLVDCYLYLQAHNLALRMVLSDTWHRYFALSDYSRAYSSMYNTWSSSFHWLATSVVYRRFVSSWLLSSLSYWLVVIIVMCLGSIRRYRVASDRRCSCPPPVVSCLPGST